LLDDDDEWLPGKLETQLRLARRHPNAALIFSDTYVKTDTATVTSFSHLNFDGRPTLEALCEKDFVQPITMLVKRSVFDALGGFDESRALIGVDDYDFCLRLFTSYPAVCSREALAMYHYHGNNYSATRRFRKAETTLLRKSLRRLRNRPNCRAVLQSRLARVRRERVLQKRRFAYEAHREAYECMLKGEFKKARGALYGAMRSRPLYTKNYAYWFFACLPHAAYLAARRLKRKVWP
jgi:GT2 family glycosyltransferase